MINLNIFLVLFANILLLGQSAKIDDFKSFQKQSSNEFLFISKAGNKLKVSWLDSAIIRVQAISKGDFTEPNTKITVPSKFDTPKVSGYDDGNSYQIVNNNGYRLIINYKPLKLSLLKGNNIIFEEAESLDLDVTTTQTLKQQSNEQFFGGGTQNGRFSHRDTNLNITKNHDWEDGGNANPVPFYMSSKGYGVFRNTFSEGYYGFKNPLLISHNETRFDAYYFLGDYRKILERYTFLTGRPFMPPAYGLEMGDSDCYYKRGNDKPDRDTLIDSTKIADGYEENDFPLGWMIVNDMFGCGYTKLAETNQALAQRNISLGLYAESDLSNIPKETKDYGVRIQKLDLAIVDGGFESSFKACNAAYNGIQDNSDARGFVWQVEGWAGAQRCSVQWTGDQYGTWENTRFHIPTIHGSGLSSLVYVSGDLNGIVGGDNITYIRDLQLKTFSPTFMGVSGWAPTDRQPWKHGEPGTSINRKYLKLREQLLPYIYTLAHEAHTTGFPIVRSMVLEFPNDPITWDKEATKYQYMFGSSFLVAPVYKDELKRDGIYLPSGKWIDYWNGKVYTGPTTLNNYPAPLDTLPLFIKQNSIIPMWNKVNSFRERRPHHPIILDIYPSEKGSTSFTLYEDDMITRQFESRKFSYQKFTLTSYQNIVTVKIGKVEGSYNGVTNGRPYILAIHSNSPKSVEFSGSKKLSSKPTLDASVNNPQGWYYDLSDDKGILYITVNTLSSSKELEIKICM